MRRIITDKNNFSKRKNNFLNTKIILAGVLAFSLILASSLGLMAIQLSAYLTDLPTEEKIRAQLAIQDENSRIYDRNGVLLYTFKNPYQDREYASFAEIPPSVILATLAAEDKDFFIHSGIDYVATLSAVFRTVSSGGDEKSGGSTITQQLIKQTLLTSTQTVERKIKEAFLSGVVEQMYTKEEILEYYLNTSSFGGRVIGIKTAAKAYFNKSLTQLDLNEAAFLVGLVRAPGEYSPLYSKDKERALQLANERRQFILEQIITNPRLLTYWSSKDLETLRKLIPEETENKPNVAQLVSKDLTVAPVQESFLAPHWVFYIRDVLAQAPHNISLDQLYNGGYEIQTSLDINIQQFGEAEVLNTVNSIGGRYGFYNASLVSVNAQTGEVLAMVGSKGFNLPNNPADRRFDPQTNVATSLQQLGSSLKPWVTYLGFVSGKYTDRTIILDAAKTFAGGYRPKNADNRFYGTMSVRRALLLSRNLPFLRMSEDIGTWRLPDLMSKIGYRKNAGYGLAATIGGVDETLLSHAGAYTGLANGGTVLALKPILNIKDRRGNIIYQGQTQTVLDLDRNAVAMVNNILGDKSYRVGAYNGKFIGNYKLAGKSGTSDQNKDNLYVGYSPQIVTAVWVGNNDNSSLSRNAFGLNTAMPIWRNFTARLFQYAGHLSDTGSY